jgi:hypothetical protein
VQALVTSELKRRFLSRTPPNKKGDVHGWTAGPQKAKKPSMKELKLSKHTKGHHACSPSKHTKGHHACSQCDAVFGQAGTLRTHARTVHEEGKTHVRTVPISAETTRARSVTLRSGWRAI